MIKRVMWVVALGATIGAHAQGVITFANSVLTSPPDRYIYDVDYTTRLVGTHYAVQLYYSTTDASSLQAHTAAPARFRAAGSSLAGTWSTATGASRTLVGGGVGVPVWVQARAWNLNQFPTWEAAVAGGGIYGMSPVFLYVQQLSTPPSPTDTYMVNFVGTWAIPEPSALLLATPGIALLLMWKRKQKQGRSGA